jgi:hypothetical protein
MRRGLCANRTHEKNDNMSHGISLISDNLSARSCMYSYFTFSQITLHLDLAFASYTISLLTVFNS